ncbi:MarR family winged helix-turn-helix transcriptional regulator [Rhizobium sp. SL86]|uniref:MarR family winged helix-turn-helix transcriptional regulator n=1 Tax=Rhizobium sp. SL86 TaxID=2995148 RepID=UPI0022726986|nr:MarR family transcriptional regulator [Rhizobium sp. SL86]MCY1664045.1 MarR family transcriptional regulator [Rhizobium sp. SL86]
MSRQSVDERLFDEISSFTRRLRSVFGVYASATGLTLTRARALFALTRRGSLSQKDLAQELEIETPTLVRILDGMEQQGLIERRGAADRRVKEIHMTAEGQVVGAEVQALAVGLRGQIVEGIAQEDLDVALRVLLQLNRNLAVAAGKGEHS